MATHLKVASRQWHGRVRATERRPGGPFMTSRETLAYLRLPSLSSLYSHIRRNRLPASRAGARLRFDQRELDLWLGRIAAANRRRG